MRKFGPSKEKRPNPIVQMGLAMDADGIPLHYELFPGNKVDKETFRSVIGEVRKNYDTGRIVVVADMGIITGDNIYYLTGGKNRNGYVFSFSVRGGTSEFKSYVLDNEGYMDVDGKPADEDAEFKIKSRRIARDINVTMKSGRKAKKTVYEKQVVFWKYADRARAQREEVVKKALDLDELVVEEKGAFNVFDRAYVDYKKFDAYCEQGILFASRLKKNALVEEVKDLPIRTGSIIKKDCIVILGKDGFTKMNHPLRYIETEDTEGNPVIIIINNFQLSSEEIGDIYRYRWQIEIFFKWIKQHLHIKHFYGLSQQAVEMQIYIALIAKLSICGKGYL